MLEKKQYKYLNLCKHLDKHLQNLFKLKKHLTIMIKLSPSSLNLFLECPKCFYLQIIKKIKRPETPFPSLPNGMDKILKEHFDRFMEKNELPPELKEEDCARDGCQLFNNKELLKLWRNNLQGLQYLDPETNILLRGAIDNLLVKENKFIVLDFKTRGYPLKENSHEHYIFQLDLYNFLLRKNNYETEDYSYLLFYYPNKVLETGEVIFDTKLIKIPANPERAERIFKQACQLLLQDQIPEPSENCEFCKLRNVTL
jgi:CRISPR/Cas system-associated exonuclease Cas4 (RecB family)